MVIQLSEPDPGFRTYQNCIARGLPYRTFLAGVSLGCNMCEFLLAASRSLLRSEDLGLSFDEPGKITYDLKILA